MLVLVQEVREAAPRLVDLDPSAGVELAPQFEQELGHLGSGVELGLDLRENAASLPEGAVLSGAALGVTLCDELDCAEGAMLDSRPGLHWPNVAKAR